MEGLINMKNLLKSKFLSIFVFTFAFTLCFSLGAVKALAADSSTGISASAKTINVTGNGEVTATPDIAYLSLGVLTEKATITEAQSLNSTAMNNVISAIKNAGIKDEDIKTSDYNISPKYNYDKNSGASTLAGYTVSNTLNVTVKDISKVGKIIDTAVANGANTSNSITFGISDYKKYYNMALQNALSDAQGKAQTISSFLNVKLTTPVTITENSSGVPNNYPIYPIELASKMDSVSSSASTTIQAGTYKIKANVSLTYQY